ncbi:nicotinate-nucleotide--dimethylbenzimidazole phosphoribosyltransferase [Streptomyces sp. NPDC007808]|uniref:nicotinate-nucleotide--dimethylbenzimidazole phosphoribosyltransferase n=1 Tax=Streptomyces sp. NPDC007808 TaxID=3364779 RepID=UPI0036964A38
MTDTGQVPAEGQPESAGMVEQPGASAAHGSYPYLSETTVEDEDLLLPGSQGAWGNEVAPPAPEPVVEAVHQPEAHELSGRDSGSVDLSAVRTPAPTAPTTPIPPITPRRPLHLGPPIPDASASPVRSLADRGAVGAPARQPGPEYFEAPQHREAAAPQAATPWGAHAQAAHAPAPAPVSVEVSAAETVVPAGEQGGVAQAVVARVATEAGAATGPGPEETGAAQSAEAGVPVPRDAGNGAAGPSAGDAGAGAEGGPVPGDGEVPGAAVGETDEAVAVAPAAEAEEIAVAAPAPEADDAATGGADAGAGEIAAPGNAVDTDTPGGPLSETDASAVEITDVAGSVAAAGTEAPAAEAAQTEADPAAVAPAAEVPAPEAVQAAEVPAPETGEVPEAAGPEAPQPAEGVAPEAPQLAEEAAPETVHVPEAIAPETVHVPEATAPETAPQPAQAVSPETEQVPAAAAAETGQSPDAPAPDGTPQPSGAPAPEAAEGTQVPDAAQDAAPAATAIAHGDPQAVAVRTAPDAAQADGSVDAEQAAPAPQPADAAAVPADDASAVVAPEAVAHPADAESAVPPQEPAVQVEQPVADPQQVPAAMADPNLAQAEPPTPVADAVPDSAESVPADASVPDAQAPQPEAAVTDDPAAQASDAGRTAEVDAVPADAPQPLAAAAVAPEAVDPQAPDAASAAAEAPEPYVAEPAGPQLRSAQAGEVPAGPPVEHTSGTGEAVSGLPSGVPLEPAPDQPLGRFVPVEGTVPTAPHLAPTPPQPIVLPPEDATVPAPRAGDPELVQHAEDLETRVADQEDTAEESTTVAEEARRSTGPAAPAYDDAEREAVLKVMRERRDIRNGFRSDPIPHEVLLRVLEAAHTAPSVGHSQPWDFVVIRSADTRRAMHELAQRQREAYARSLPKGRAKQFKELKIEAILDTPVNIVVTADPTRGGRHTLGRHTQPQMAPYSAALAVENLWLAARAEGLGVGWVSFFDEREMVRALGLPEHLEVIAYLCVGYVDEFPEEPELMQAGWSKRRPLSWVVHEETYGRRALPGEEPHDLLAETVAQIRPLDAKALGEAWERQKRMTKPAGALGMLEIISAQLSGLSRQCPPPIPEPAAVAIFAGDHGVHAQGVTPWPQEVTAQMVANFLGGGAVCNAFAGQVGAEVCVVDVGVAADLPATPGLLPRKVRAGTSDMTTGPAMTREEAKQAIEVGIETARDLVAAGNKALLTGEMGIANTTASAALISVFTDTDPAEVTGRGTGINDETLARKTEVVRRAIELHQPDPADPVGVLAAIGGFEHAALVGLLLGGASLRTPVILDGVSAGAAALVARAIAPEVLAACIAGHRSAEPGHVAALNKLGLRPLVDLDLRLGEGTGALLALPLVQSTARAMHEVATFDSAGVTEK